MFMAIAVALVVIAVVARIALGHARPGDGETP